MGVHFRKLRDVEIARAHNTNVSNVKMPSVETTRQVNMENLLDEKRLKKSLRQRNALNLNFVAMQ